MGPIKRPNKLKYPFHHELNNFESDSEGRKNFVSLYREELLIEYEKHCEEYEIRTIELGGDKNIHMPETEHNPPIPFFG